MAFIAEHVSEELWGDYIEGRLSDTEAAQVRAHLETGCPKCSRQGEQWKKMLGAMERARTGAPPQSVLERAFALFESRAPEERSSSERPRPLLERLLASLVFDSRQNLMPALARASTAVSFNQVYSAGDTTVYLSCEFDGLRWQITGQVESDERFLSIVANGDDGLVRAEMDEYGEFRLPGLFSGRYDFMIPGEIQELVLPAVDLAPS